MNSKFITAVNTSTVKIIVIEGSATQVKLTLNGELVARANFGYKFGFGWSSGPNFEVIGCDSSVRDAIYAKALPVHERRQLNDFDPKLLNNMVENSTHKVVFRENLVDVVFSYGGYELCTVAYLRGQKPVTFWAFDEEHISGYAMERVATTARIARY